MVLLTSARTYAGSATHPKSNAPKTSRPSALTFRSFLLPCHSKAAFLSLSPPLQLTESIHRATFLFKGNATSFSGTRGTRWRSSKSQVHAGHDDFSAMKSTNRPTVSPCQPQRGSRSVPPPAAARPKQATRSITRRGLNSSLQQQAAS